MSMIEKFLSAKNELRENLAEVKEEMLEAATAKADKLIDEFIEGFKLAILDASDEEFIEFITSGKLDDEDLTAALMFRAHGTKTSNEPREEVNEKCEPRVHVIVLEV